MSTNPTPDASAPAQLTSVTSIWPNGAAYFFKGSQYAKYDVVADQVPNGWPKAIAGNWDGFPPTFTTAVNAQVMWNNGKAYFFKGSQYIAFDVAADQVAWGPLAIAANWPGLFTSNIDAALPWNNGKAYFFKGSQYIAYDMATDQASVAKPIVGNWSGFPATFAAGVNAAVMWNNGKAYFFKGSQYIAYDVATDQVASGPTAISAEWLGLFPSNIDA